MKNLLSKAMLCGVLASTVVLVNCQKAPNKPVKPTVNQAGKVQGADAAKMTLCTADMLKEIASTKEASAKLADAIKKAEKENVTRLSNELKAQTEKAAGLIKAVKVGEGDKKQDAEGCNEHEGNDVKKKLIKAHTIKDMSGVINGLGLEAKKLSGEDNDITKGITAQSNAIVQGAMIQVTSVDLAKALSDDANANGAVVISNGKLLKDAEAKAALENEAVTACSLGLTIKEEVKVGSFVKVLSLEAKGITESQKRNTLSVIMARDAKANGADADLESGTAVLALNCNIAKGKEKVAGEEVRKALGSLILDVKSETK